MLSTGKKRSTGKQWHDAANRRIAELEAMQSALPNCKCDLAPDEQCELYRRITELEAAQRVADVDYKWAEDAALIVCKCGNENLLSEGCIVTCECGKRYQYIAFCNELPTA